MVADQVALINLTRSPELLSATSITDASIDSQQNEPTADKKAIDRAISKNAGRADEIDHFCDLNDQLKKAPLFTEHQGTRDAAPFLASKVDWEAAEGGAPRIGSLHLAEPLRLRVREPDWREALTATDVQGLDFTWLAQLSEFNVWTLRGDGAMGTTNLPATMTPLPNLELLEWHARLRMVQAGLTNDDASARSEIHHLAFLISTIGGAVPEVMSARLLAVTGEIDATRRDLTLTIAQAAITFAVPGVSSATRGRALSCSAMPCALVLEGAAMHSALRPWRDERDAWKRDTAALRCDERAMTWLMTLPPAKPEQLGWLFER